MMGWPNTAVAPVMRNSKGHIKRDGAGEMCELETRCNLCHRVGTFVMTLVRDA